MYFIVKHFISEEEFYRNLPNGNQCLGEESSAFLKKSILSSGTMTSFTEVWKPPQALSYCACVLLIIGIKY